VIVAAVRGIIIGVIIGATFGTIAEAFILLALGRDDLIAVQSRILQPFIGEGFWLVLQGIYIGGVVGAIWGAVFRGRGLGLWGSLFECDMGAIIGLIMGAIVGWSLAGVAGAIVGAIVGGILVAGLGYVLESLTGAIAGSIRREAGGRRQERSGSFHHL
jgi:hypothetical protein